jgi:hypothetical protein
VDSIVNVFGWPVVPPHPDLILLRKLAVLPSYDVYQAAEIGGFCASFALANRSAMRALPGSGGPGGVPGPGCVVLARPGWRTARLKRVRRAAWAGAPGCRRRRSG